ncbi:MAG: glucose-6-phosphate dehydrogenase assembly protein OpcA [Pseudanabaena sp. ELA607]|jgi:glucose-6-phosphate dehydrogenase assembly protein OpcA
MNTQVPALVSIQSVMDVSVSQVQQELSKIWQSYGDSSAARATTFNLLIYEPEGLSNELRMASIDAIASQSPCRVIDLLPIDGEDEGITAQVAAYCPLQKNRSALICGEYITLQGTKDAFNRIYGLIAELLIPELPVFAWWKASPAPYTRLFEKLVNLSDRIIMDSTDFAEPEADLLKVYTMHNSGINVADLNWQRLAPWQELTAQAFDPPDRRAAVWDVDGITLDYEKGNPAQPLLFLGWIASRLGWQPIKRVCEGGEYDIQRITFASKSQPMIEAELAAIPVSNPGSVVGDLMGLRLQAANLNTDACHVFCSESTGCMRMEASGGAQKYQVHQVSPLSDQSADMLLAQQLQRWGTDPLYEESLAVVAQILNLS